MNFSPADLLQLARLSSAVYMLRDGDQVAAIGMREVAQVGNVECQVTIATWGGYSVVGIRGTQVMRNLSLPELFDDLDNEGLVLAHGQRVHRHFWEPLVALWPHIEACGLGAQVLITGHSLGGVRSLLAKRLCPRAQVVAFGPPRGADDAFWTATYPDYPPDILAHAQDFALAWPWDGPWTQPAQLSWLHNGVCEQVSKRTGWCTSVADHSIDTGYIPALEALVAAAPEV